MTTYLVNGKRMDGNENLTKNFKVREFASKDGSTTIVLDMKMVSLLQKLRDAIGEPIVINSAYRSPKHNANVGGAKGSQHVKGTAVDIRQSANYNPTQIAGFMLTLGFTGVSIYNTFAHGDTRKLSGGQKYVTWGKYTNKLKPLPLPNKPSKPEKPKPVEYRYETDIIGFDIGQDTLVEIRGFKRYTGNSHKFLQFMAVRDLECLGVGVDWVDGKTTLTKEKNLRKANLNLNYVVDNMTHAMVKLELNGKEVFLEGHVNYDKHKNATRFIAIQDLQELGFSVSWDSKRRVVVLR